MRSRSVSSVPRTTKRAERAWPRASNHAGLAAALASAGQDDAAIVEYERAAALGAEPAVYRQLANLYAKIGRAPDAARARVRYEAALQGNASRAR